MDRVEQISQAAVRLFTANGYERTSVSEIASEAGVAKGLIYNYFDSKEVLLDMIVLRAVQDYLDHLDEIGEEDNSPADEFGKLVRETVKFRTGRSGLWRFITSIGLRPNSSELIRKALEKSDHEMVNRISRQFSKLFAEDPEGKALFCLSAITGILYDHYRDPDSFPAESSVERLIGYLLNEDQ